MSRPGSPGTWDRELHWAFASAGSRRRKRVPPYRYGQTLITEATTRLPWGRSTHAAGYLSHAVRAVYLGWRGPRLAGWAVRWRCGATTRHFRLEEEPTGPICPLCTLERLDERPTT